MPAPREYTDSPARKSPTVNRLEPSPHSSAAARCRTAPIR